MNRRAVTALILLAALLGVCIAARLAVGGTTHWGQMWELRGQRVLGGVIAGSSLAVGGVFLQCLMRNPLASTDLLGMGSGAGLAVMIVSLIATATSTGTVQAGIGLPAAGVASLAGSLGALSLVYAFSQRRGLIDPIWLVLVGVVVGVMCGAGMSLVQHFMPLSARELASRWMRGSISDDLSWPELVVAGAGVLAVILAGLWYAPAMDAAALPDDEARSVGVQLSGLRFFLFLASGVLAAAAVVIAGPIGFVGIVCPHVVRLAAGPAHRPLVIGAALTGATLLVAADIAVKLIDLPGGRLPIGVLTALVGGPVLVVMLRRWARAPWSA